MSSRDRSSEHVRAQGTRLNAVLRSLAYAASITSVGVAALGLAVTHPDHTARLWGRLARRTIGHRTGDLNCAPGRVWLAGHAVMSVLLGLVGWMLIAIVGLMVARGALYGFVDAGPYDQAWGGPTLGGAWITHFAVSLPILAASMLLAVGVTGLHRRTTRRLEGTRAPWWVVPIVFMACAAAALFFIAWSRQV
ncbi:MAG: hypothetical protein ACRDRH_12370 [Pseudonocardia sp.]